MPDKSAWHSFVLETAPHERAVLAAFNPDTVYQSIVAVFAHRIVRWYDVAMPTIPKAPLRQIDAPPQFRTNADATATCAVLFKIDPVSQVNTDAARLSRPAGAIGTSNGKVEIFAERGYMASWRMPNESPVVSVVVVSALTPSEGGDRAGASANVSGYESPTVAGVAPVPAPESVAESTELTENPRGGERPVSWAFSVAALNRNGDIMVFQPQSLTVSVSMAKAVIAEPTFLHRIRCIASCGHGVLYHSGLGAAGKISCLTHRGREAEPELEIPASVWSPTAMACHQYVVVIARGRTVWLVNFLRRQQVVKLFKAASEVTLLSLHFPAVVAACKNGEVVCYSLKTAAVVARTCAISRPVQLSFHRARGIVVAVDELGSIELLELPAAAGVLDALRADPVEFAQAHVLRCLVDCDAAAAKGGTVARVAQAKCLLAKFIVPECVAKYVGTRTTFDM
jgi:hypothetical protein